MSKEDFPFEWLFTKFVIELKFSSKNQPDGKKIRMLIRENIIFRYETKEKIILTNF